MKKLLSLLAISATLSSSSLATISCEGQVKKLNLNKEELEKELKRDVKPDVNPYNIIYGLIAKLAGEGVSAQNIQNDTKIKVKVFEDNQLLSPDSVLSVGKYIKVTLEVLPEDQYFQQVNEYTINVGYLNKVTLTKNNINISADTIKANTTYKAEYDNFRTQIGNLAGIDPSVIATGSEKDNVLISLIVNGNAVTSSDTTFKYGDTISMKLKITANSRYYSETQNWMESNTIQLKAQLTKDVINLTSIIPDQTTYNGVYDIARKNIADVVGIDPSEIKNGSEADKVLISLIVNGNAVKDTDTTIKYGDVVSIKFEVVGNSKYYMDTANWIESNEFSEKVTISNLSFTSEPIGTTYGSLYAKERSDIANLAGISPETIKTGSEADKVFISIFVNGQWVSENSVDTIKANDKIEEKAMVLNTSKYFNSMSWTTFNTNVPKATITDDTPLNVNTGTLMSNILYDIVDTQIAQIAGIDPYLIIYGEESRNFDIRLYLNGTSLPNFGQEVTITKTDSLVLRLHISPDSQYYNQTTSEVVINVKINE